MIQIIIKKMTYSFSRAICGRDVLTKRAHKGVVLLARVEDGLSRLRPHAAAREVSVFHELERDLARIRMLDASPAGHLSVEIPVFVGVVPSGCVFECVFKMLEHVAHLCMNALCLSRACLAGGVRLHFGGWML
jgi:hypothetical protein